MRQQLQLTALSGTPFVEPDAGVCTLMIAVLDRARLAKQVRQFAEVLAGEK